MAVPKTAALPLGYAPTRRLVTPFAGGPQPERKAARSVLEQCGVQRYKARVPVAAGVPAVPARSPRRGGGMAGPDLGCHARGGRDRRVLRWARHPRLRPTGRGGGTSPPGTAMTRRPVVGSKISTPPSPSPPATSTRPSPRTVAVCLDRPFDIEAPSIHPPRAGSYTSVDASTSALNVSPPITKRRPSSSCTAA